MSTDHQSQLWRLIDITKSLSTEKDKWRLLERILMESLHIAQCDGGTLYLLQTDNEGTWLDYGIVHNERLQLHQINRDRRDSALMPIALYEARTGTPNHRNIAAHCALTGQSVTLADAYRETDFDSGGIRAFDDLFDYRTQSVLTLPLMDHADQVIGVLQLINAKDDSGQVVPFSEEKINYVQALASLVAITLDNRLMMEEESDLLIRLSRARSINQLFSHIVDEALTITRAEGGTLYLCRNEPPRQLEFAIIKNEKLGLHLGGDGAPIENPRPIPLENDGEANLQHIATFTALSKQMVNVDNAYDNATFDFSGMIAFDERHGYCSRSFLSAPLINHAGQVIGVLQLVNARDPEGQVTAFSPGSEPIVQALAAYAATVLENQMLLEEQHRLHNSASHP